MRIWSLHPKYLDSKGLVALWRETLLAKYVLEGKTKGYKNHPQLYRFKEATNPLGCINQYLAEVYSEAINRGYNFNKNKIKWNFKPASLTVTKGQLNYEITHLLNKLKIRDNKKYIELLQVKKFSSHPLFKIVKGDVEKWEIIKPNFNENK
jgi:Pyrimidine dimer DNA glycosylase